MTEAERRAALEAIAAEVRACTSCRLHERRTRAVPGEGHPSTEVVFVGEGPDDESTSKAMVPKGRTPAETGKVLRALLEEEIDLVLDWKRVSPGLAVPPCDFGIVAGGRGDEIGYSRLLAGDDDAVVCVEETRLEGARDFLLVPVHHAAMMKHPAVQRATVSFLEMGRFDTEPPTGGEDAPR